MNDHQRLQDLQEILDLLYSQLGEYQKELIVNANPDIQFQLKQRIKKKILPQMRQYEREYWEIYPTENIKISNEEAESQLTQIEQALDLIESIEPNKFPQELISLLKDIRTKLEESDKAASAKLKLALPLIPAIASYELEMDTEEFMYKVWQSIKKILKKKARL